jgi:DNA-binding CsgD family transcriptional regulator
MELRRDLIEVVEQCYALDGSEADWMLGLVRALPEDFDEGLGVHAHTLALRPGKPARFGPIVGTASPEAVALYQRINSEAEGGLSATDLAAVHQLTFGSGRPYGTTSECFTAVRDPKLSGSVARGPAGQGGVLDSRAILAVDPSGEGMVVQAPLRNPTRTTARERRRYGSVAAHLAAGLRLRRGLAAGGAPLEAVLAPDGACVHAECPAQPRSAREALRVAAKAIDRARGRLRRTDEQEALAIWRGLCGGRWSLVDQFESDGRRFVVARQNEPEVRDPRELSARERQVAGFAALGRTNKFIAYTLGISTSAVAFHLRNAARKLAVSTRTELVLALRRIALPSAAP